MTLFLGLFLIGILGLSCLSTGIFKQQDQALAQQSIQTTKSRNLAIDLGNGLKTSAQLTYPAIGKGQFPGVLLIPGSGITYKKETVGFVHNYGSKSSNSQLHFGKYPNINQKEVLKYFGMLREMLVQIILFWIHMYGEMLQSMI